MGVGTVVSCELWRGLDVVGHAVIAVGGQGEVAGEVDLDADSLADDDGGEDIEVLVQDLHGLLGDGLREALAEVAGAGVPAGIA